MARRGKELREHILWTAKDTFIELGFERTSMDEVARNASASKRSLYAHFENKENLFLAVVELVRGLFLTRLKQPDDYSVDSKDALVMFCTQYLKSLLYEKSVQMMRVCMAESTRFPEGAAQYFEVIFAEVHIRLSTYLETTYGLSPTLSEETAQALLGQLLYPHLPRALFGMDPLAESLDDDLPPHIEPTLVHRVVTKSLTSLQHSSR